MSRPDEALIHAWLDGALAPDEAARVERLVATDPAWGAAAAEARGVLAGASRILRALDHVPGDVLPQPTGAAPRARRAWWRHPALAAAATLALAVGVGRLAWQREAVTDVGPAADRAVPTPVPAAVATAPVAPEPTTVAAARARAAAPVQRGDAVANVAREAAAKAGGGDRVAASELAAAPRAAEARAAALRPACLRVLLTQPGNAGSASVESHVVAHPGTRDAADSLTLRWTVAERRLEARVAGADTLRGVARDVAGPAEARWDARAVPAACVRP